MQYTEVEPNIFNVYKPAGYTPLQALDVLREELGLGKHVPMTYAGRLDPMAEGLLLVLVGEAVHKKDEYLKLDKQYRITALLGVETDSGDLLGLIQKTNDGFQSSLASDWLVETGMTEQNTNTLLKSYIGQISLPLPLYSSPLVSGKPLFAHAQAGSLNRVDAPIRTTNIYECALEKMGRVSSSELLSYIVETIPKVHGEFRQAETLQAWQRILKDNFHTVTVAFSVHCSSGTYVRSLVEKLGKDLGTTACAYKLIRTKIGTYTA